MLESAPLPLLPTIAALTSLLIIVLVVVDIACYRVRETGEKAR